MEEVSSNMLELNARMTNTEDCVYLEILDTEKKFGEEKGPIQPTHGEAVEQLEQNLHATLKSLEEFWCEQKKLEQEKYKELLGDHTKLKSDHESVRSELAHSNQSEFSQLATIHSHDVKEQGVAIWFLKS